MSDSSSVSAVSSGSTASTSWGGSGSGREVGGSWEQGGRIGSSRGAGGLGSRGREERSVCVGVRIEIGSEGVEGVGRAGLTVCGSQGVRLRVCTPHVRPSQSHTRTRLVRGNRISTHATRDTHTKHTRPPTCSNTSLLFLAPMPPGSGPSVLLGSLLGGSLRVTVLLLCRCMVLRAGGRRAGRSRGAGGSGRDREEVRQHGEAGRCLRVCKAVYTHTDTHARYTDIHMHPLVLANTTLLLPL